jgi:hypothetical protein
MRNLVRIFERWLLPPGIFAWLKEIRQNKRQNLYRKNWHYGPIDFGLHEASCFISNRKKSAWLSLNQESRVAIEFRQSTDLLIDLHDNTGCIQFGVGQPISENAHNCDISIFLNDILVSEIKCVESGVWNDVKIPILHKNKKISLRIEQTLNDKLFLSHPVISPSHSVSFSNEKQFSKPKNIICIILDALIPEDLAQGTGTATSNINSFFSEATVCSNVFSQGDWTLPAFSSMLTGHYPINHNCNNPDHYDSALSDDLLRLPECLLCNDYRTFGYSSHARFSPAYGHAKGFERFIYRQRNERQYYPQIINEAITNLESNKNDSNFMFLHFFDTHHPYYPYSYLQNNLMSEFRDYGAFEKHKKKKGQVPIIKYLMDQRKTKLYEVDLALDSLFSYLKKQVWFDDSIVILTADHGTSFMPRNMPFTLDQIRIPLLVKMPFQDKRKEESSFIEGSVDLMPSILHLAGADSPQDIDGKIWPFLGGEARGKIFSESLYHPTYEAILIDKQKCFYFSCPYDTSGVISFELREPVKIFNYSKNKPEQENIASAFPELVENFTDFMFSHINKQS